MHKNEVAIDIVSRFMEKTLMAIMLTEDESDAEKLIKSYEFLEELKACLINDECPRNN